MVKAFEDDFVNFDGLITLIKHNRGQTWKEKLDRLLTDFSDLEYHRPGEDHHEDALGLARLQKA